VRERERAQLARQGERHEIVRTRQELRALGREPTLGVRGVTRRAVPIATGNGELTITCLMESTSFWGARVWDRVQTPDMWPVRPTVHSP
jgi:hypothetical protein